jgi:hypothetical protein
MRIKNAQ